MKVYLLMCHSSYQGYEFTSVVSVHSSYPEVPVDKHEPCKCCWETYSVDEFEVQT